MYDLVYKHKRIAQFILALIMIPFAFFGVDYYLQRGGRRRCHFDGGKIGEAELRRRCASSRTAAQEREGSSVDLRQPRGPLQPAPALIGERPHEKKGAELRFQVER
jgi:hypothetical protein